MFSSEIKEVVYIAISAILLSIVLTFVSTLIGVRNDLAEIRNNEIHSAQDLEKYREFNKYNGTNVFGEDIIEAIRQYYNSDLTIYVNKSGSTGTSYTVTKDAVRAGSVSVDLDYLQNRFKPTSKFQAILAYDFRDPATITAPMDESKITSEVTGITFIYKGER